MLPTDLDDGHAPDADVIRELHYCATAPGFRFASGQVARAQTRALAMGWLTPAAAIAGSLTITPSGRALLARLHDLRPGANGFSSDGEDPVLVFTPGRIPPHSPEASPA